MGVHGWNADQSVQKFHELSKNGFLTKILAKHSLFGWLARWVYGSIYDTESLKPALQTAYTYKSLFELRLGESQPNPLTKVAVTTTVNSECKLFANYDCMDSKSHLNSDTDRCK